MFHCGLFSFDFCWVSLIIERNRDVIRTKCLPYPNLKIPLHNPDDKRSPLYQYLVKCGQKGAGISNEKHVTVTSYDFKSKGFQADDELVVIGEKTWGRDLKSLMKYLVLRYYRG
jgi:hypothetical protein